MTAGHAPILCTFPGKHGDLLWALPTVRALAQAVGAPVDLAIAAGIGGLAPLLRRQAYIGQVHVLVGWTTENTAPISPRVPPVGALDGVLGVTADTAIYDLGYDGWPSLALPYQIDLQLRRQHRGVVGPPDLTTPWITPPWDFTPHRAPVVVGFTDEYFELKVGVTDLLRRRALSGWRDHFNVSCSPRWQAERGLGACSWDDAASWMAAADVFLGCCSALHVLAVAVGCPAVVMEPNPDRHHPIFWPLGTTGPQVTQVLGGDGKWTWDVRHVAETLDAVRASRRGR